MALEVQIVFEGPAKKQAGFKTTAKKMDSGPRIVFEGKASNRFESGTYAKYVSISKRFATPPSDARWDPESIFKIGVAAGF